MLHEIRHSLNRLIETGESSVIDLRSIPLAPGEEEKILTALGRGELRAELDALGKSEIIETQYAGVWLISHYNENEEIIGRFIEVTVMPDILCSQSADMIDASQRLAEALQDTGGNNEGG
ncbi:MAG TPA: hydrogenase accessory protein HupE [Gammaproteobacteria bacterium]|nr:hydrogenase accessory protein HupE [Gammaproteobacteria bacterium]